MSEDELRDILAAFRSMTGATPLECYQFADEMMIVRTKRFWVNKESENEDENDEQDGGITAVVPKRTRKR